MNNGISIQHELRQEKSIAKFKGHVKRLTLEERNWDPGDQI